MAGVKVDALLDEESGVADEAEVQASLDELLARKPHLAKQDEVTSFDGGARGQSPDTKGPSWSATQWPRWCTVTTPARACPECAGHFLDDATGLRFEHGILCTMRTAEDSTAEADRRRLAESLLAQVHRPATTAEVALGVPAGATFTVSPVTSGLGVVNRAWST